MPSKQHKLAAATLLVFAGTLAPVLAADDHASCKKLFVAKGTPSKTEAVAQLSAVRIWSETVKERHGAEYSVWHKAGRQSLKCLPIKNEDYLFCTARGQPCKYVSAAKNTK